MIGGRGEDHRPIDTEDGPMSHRYDDLDSQERFRAHQ